MFFYVKNVYFIIFSMIYEKNTLSCEKV